jgi:hypothetical protein
VDWTRARVRGGKAVSGGHGWQLEVRWKGGKILEFHGLANTVLKSLCGVDKMIMI